MSLSALSAYQCRRGEPAEEARYSLQTREEEEEAAEGGSWGWSGDMRGVLAPAKGYSPCRGDIKKHCRGCWRNTTAGGFLIERNRSCWGCFIFL